MLAVDSGLWRESPRSCHRVSHGYDQFSVALYWPHFSALLGRIQKSEDSALGPKSQAMWSWRRKGTKLDHRNRHPPTNKSSNKIHPKMTNLVSSDTVGCGHKFIANLFKFSLNLVELFKESVDFILQITSVLDLGILLQCILFYSKLFEWFENSVQVVIAKL